MTDQLVAAYRSGSAGQRLAQAPLPSRRQASRLLPICFGLLYPGYHEWAPAEAAALQGRTEALLMQLRVGLAAQLAQVLPAGEDVDGRVEAFLAQLPAQRALLLEDVQAAYDGDPAAPSWDEALLTYPGVLAVSVHRLAHVLWQQGVPLLPRMWSAWAHSRTGADIHPGAQIGRRFFIDHATGVVIGETAVIGAGVKLYQGVTLGALSIRQDPEGRAIRGQKRHPTLEDGVTLYANATVLGGDTVIGSQSVLGGSVFVTRSVPANSRLVLRPAASSATDFEI